MTETGFLRGRHAIITGGGKGIGAAIATALAGKGADLTLLGRDRKALESHGAKLAERFQVRVQSLECDVADAKSIERAFSAAIEKFGVPFILVNNAGQAEAASFVDNSREMWDRTLAVNLTGTALCSQQVVAGMMKAGSGRIINIASTAALKGYTKMAAYCASKHGVVGLTRALALETVKFGVTVNAVCPGYTETDMAKRAIENVKAALGKSDDEARKILLRQNPRGTFIQPEEVADEVLRLCAPEAAEITGQAIPIAGGEAM